MAKKEEIITQTWCTMFFILFCFWYLLRRVGALLTFSTRQWWFQLLFCWGFYSIGFINQRHVLEVCELQISNTNLVINYHKQIVINGAENPQRSLPKWGSFMLDKIRFKTAEWKWNISHIIEEKHAHTPVPARRKALQQNLRLQASPVNRGWLCNQVKCESSNA